MVISFCFFLHSSLHRWGSYEEIHDIAGRIEVCHLVSKRVHGGNQHHEIHVSLGESFNCAEVKVSQSERVSKAKAKHLLPWRQGWHLLEYVGCNAIHVSRYISNFGRRMHRLHAFAKG